MDLIQVLILELQSRHDAEMGLARALPVSASKAYDQNLRNQLETYTTARWDHVGRLEEIFREVGCPISSAYSLVTRALNDQTLTALKEMAPSDATDCYILNSTLKAIHLGIASYGSTRQIADSLKLPVVSNLLAQSLVYELEARDSFNQIAAFDAFQAAQEQPMILRRVA